MLGIYSYNGKETGRYYSIIGNITVTPAGPGLEFFMANNTGKKTIILQTLGLSRAVQKGLVLVQGVVNSKCSHGGTSNTIIQIKTLNP